MAKVKQIQRSTVDAGTPIWANVRPDVESKKIDGITRDYNRLFWDAHYYVHNEIDDGVKVKSLIRYVEKKHGKETAAPLRNMPDSKLVTFGVYAYMLEHGVTLDKKLSDSFTNHVKTLLGIAKEIEVVEPVAKPKPTGPVLSIQERMREQLDELCCQLNGMVDDIMAEKVLIGDFKPDHMIQLYSQEHSVIKPAHAKILREVFTQQHKEATEVVAWKDDQLKEGYSHLSAKQRKLFLEIFQRIMNACDAIINAGKAVRKTRKPKARSADKVVAKLKCMQSDPKLGLASVAPSTLLKAKTLWVFNTKNRKLGCYVVNELAEFLSVKGTTIINYDPALSMQKTIRKPEVLLKGAGKLSRTRIQKLYDDVNATEIKQNGRINEHILLLNVF